MAQELIAVLQGSILPKVERLERAGIVVPGEGGKRAFGPYPPARDRGQDGIDLPGGTFSYKGHPVAELVFVISGRAELALDGKRYAMEEGEFAVIPPHVPHLERILSADQSYHLIWVRAGTDRIAMHSSSYSRGNRFQLIRSATLTPSGAAGRHLLRAVEEVQERGTGWESALRASVVQGLVSAIRHLQAHGRGQTRGEGRQGVVDIAKAFIQAHFSEALTLEEIAREVFLSPNYFSSVFTQGAGMTVFEYLQNVRLEEAKRLLSETERPVDEIARRVGIQTPSYFSRLFKRYTGQSARDYRRAKHERVS